MPLADYKCDTCGAVIESENGNAPQCCGGTMRKVWAVPGIKFKGSGFYVNDYKGGRNDSQS